MVAVVTLKKGDFGFNVDFTILNNDLTPRDLTGLTTKLKVWLDPLYLVINPTLTLQSPFTSGITRWAVTSTDMASLTGGVTYSAEVELTSGGYVESTETFQMVVLPSP